MSKENFKVFAKSHPEFVKYVQKGETSWQRLYELYDIYGANSNIWNNYFTSDRSVATTPGSLGDIVKTIKNVDLDSVQKGIENIQKTIGLIQGLGIGDAASESTNNYEPRPMYKYFED